MIPSLRLYAIIIYLCYRKYYIFQDMRFNHDIDARTGYKTHSLLCMPIKDFNGEVMGVAQVSFTNFSC